MPPSSDSTVSSGNAVSPGGNEITIPGDTGFSDGTPNSGISPAPDSGEEDSPSAVTCDGLPAYELPYLPLS